tara:strand:+ start:1212 stop:1544 length:333 start_codon:yes stop_codon:yes gene_type:complete
MKESELRIGNYVYYYKEIIQVPHLDNSLVKKIKTIPLTEEWLFKFGFELESKHKHEYNYIKSPLIYNTYHKQTLLFKPIVNKKLLLSNDIKSVHQLQNLYFALTGKELII